MDAGARIGAHNDLTDVAGFTVGHHQRSGRGWLTGTTVVLTPPDTVAGVDVRGGGPATRETDALAPTTMVEHAQAVCFTGGSAYGLDVAGGVMRWLEEQQRGFPVGPASTQVVPIVPTAALFDLGAGGSFTNRPDASFGYRAAKAARRGPIRQGTVGAGTGAHAGPLKGGIGSASVVSSAGITVAALVALNAGGSVVDPRTGDLWGLRLGIGDEFATVGPPTRAEARAAAAEGARAVQPLNTTLAVIATDAVLTKPECHRLAAAGHDGLARAISPVHRYTDGDVVVALASGDLEVPDEAGDEVLRPASARVAQLGLLAELAADAVSRAIVHAVLRAEAAGGMPTYLDRYPTAARPRPR